MVCWNYHDFYKIISLDSPREDSLGSGLEEHKSGPQLISKVREIREGLIEEFLNCKCPREKMGRKWRNYLLAWRSLENRKLRSNIRIWQPALTCRNRRERWRTKENSSTDQRNHYYVPLKDDWSWSLHLTWTVRIMSLFKGKNASKQGYSTFIASRPGDSVPADVQVQNVPSSRVYVFGNDCTEEVSVEDSALELSELRPRGKGKSTLYSAPRDIQKTHLLERKILPTDSLQSFALQYGCTVSTIGQSMAFQSDRQSRQDLGWNL